MEFRVDKNSILHFAVGKTSFGEKQLVENYGAALDEVMRLKPSAAKGRYLTKANISTTMGPGIPVDPTTHPQLRGRRGLTTRTPRALASRNAGAYGRWIVCCMSQHDPPPSCLSADRFSSVDQSCVARTTKAATTKVATRAAPGQRRRARCDVRIEETISPPISPPRWPCQEMLAPTKV